MERLNYKKYQPRVDNTQLKKVRQRVAFQDQRDDQVSQLQEIANRSNKKMNNTGLPHQLKSGIESLSGYSMDDVKVHYNSSKPAQLNAYAYAQGTDIHVASGQEKHLPHEAWHVVQQKQGRVQPTRQMKGKVNINDDAGLEREADMMGAKALQMKYVLNTVQQKNVSGDTVQMASSITYESQTLPYNLGPGMAINQNAKVGKKTVAKLDKADLPKGSSPGLSGQDDAIYAPLDNAHPTETFIRGHLLNDNLGGLGIPANIYPITSNANSQHSKEVEEPVKAAVLAGNVVDYTVKANWLGGGGNFRTKPRSEFDCEAKIGATTFVKTTIISDPLSRSFTHNERLGGGTSGAKNSSGSGEASSRLNKANLPVPPAVATHVVFTDASGNEVGREAL
ncbi:DUF4157 domain-containing protein [bacterium SCSIO 12643]|nr:DUF4157 domain-containing protein [bacterium SCSIO 12643]